MSLNTLLFEHLRHFTLVVGRLEATGEFTLGTMNATVRNEHREVRFQAQYLVRKPKGNLTYSPMFTPDVEGFIGWLPYFNRRWEEGFDKLAFKRRCERLGLPVPAWSADRIEPALGDVVIKAARGSSFGHGVRGPYRASDAAAMSLHPGEYAEAFVPGQIGKVWYWGERVVALELSDPAHAVGDGIPRWRRSFVAPAAVPTSKPSPTSSATAASAGIVCPLRERRSCSTTSTARRSPRGRQGRRTEWPSWTAPL